MGQTPPWIMVTPAELERTLERALAEQWSELAIVGPGVSKSEASASWPDAWFSYGSMYQLRAPLPEVPELVSKLKALSSLALLGLHVGQEGARHLATLSGLESLTLWSNSIGAEGAKHIARLSGLARLDLEYNNLGDEGAKHVSTLPSLTALDLWNNGLTDAAAKHISKLTRLTSLDLGYNQLGDHSASHLSALASLTSLNIGNGKLTHLGAKHLTACEHLRSLDLWNNDVGDRGVEHLSSLTGLTTLNVGSNNLSAEGAQHIAKLTYLTSLNLANNNVGPDGAKHVSRLTGLNSLSLANNELGDAGARHLTTLTGLTSLSVGHNDISAEGAKHLSTLSRLTKLNIGDNKLGAAGARHLSALTQLTRLDLGSNHLGANGAEALSALTGLVTLFLPNNNLGVDALKHLSSLTALTHLNIGNNALRAEGAKHLTALPGLTSLFIGSNDLGPSGARYLAELRNLTALNARNNKLGDDGARQLSALSHLTVLILGGNNLSDEGARHLSRLTSLVLLDLQNNKIGDDGARHLSTLTGLTSLRLKTNQLGDKGAEHLAALTHLTSLDLSGNNVGDDGAKHVATLEHLNTLVLSGTTIGDDGVEHFSSLKHLTSLNLAINYIGDRGARSLSALTNLTLLDLSSTHVTDLSPFVGMMERGIPVSPVTYESSALFVGNCPLVRPPMEIVSQGRLAVLNYFRELERQGVAHLYEAKVLVIGKGGAGKTSLVRRLYQPDLPLPAVDETTRGIEIHRQSFAPARTQADPFWLNVWDFGGQQIYHATHQFFFTKSSLYVLVDDTKDDAKSVHDEGFKFWLELVEVFGGQSPVLIFQNEKAGRSKNIDEAGIKGRFPNVQGIYRGDLEQAAAAEPLQRAIQHSVQNLQHVGEALPARWLEIRHAIEALASSRAYISQQEYFALYGRYLELDQAKALHLSRFLHDLGVFLHFQDDRLLRDTVFLQNEWATEAVFRMLDDEPIKAQQGRFDEADCARVWGGRDWQNKELQLLTLMEKFELCYKLPDTTPAQWLVPQLLSPSAPVSIVREPKPHDLVLQYRYAFLPRGLVNRLMVRMHRFVGRPELAWVSGVLFEHEASSVIVTTADNGREVHLRARGPDRRALLNVIASDLDALNGTFRGLDGKVDKWVACCCATCELSSEPHLFSERTLKKRRDSEEAEAQLVQCELSFMRVHVQQLLDGTDVSKLPGWASARAQAARASDVQRPTPPERTLKIFIASSSELRQERDAFDLYLRRQNDHLRQDGLYLDIVRWEHSLDAMSATRLQDQYNQAVRDSDVFVSLFATKAGAFTREEFGVALEAFKLQGKPLIYTYFKDVRVSPHSKEGRRALQTLWDFQDELERLGHFFTMFESVDQLSLHFGGQIDLLRRRTARE